MPETSPSVPASEALRPALLTALAQGYGGAALRADLIAGLTVAIVALPLSMAIAIASGVGPERGLYTAIIGGALVSGLGGSRYQIGGPAGAFIVLVAACVAQIGIGGLMLATFLSGVMLAALGLARLGSTIRFIPYPVTVGFTTGIGVIIFASQIKEIFGLSLGGPEPGPLVPKLAALWSARETASPVALAVAVGTIALIQSLKRYAPRLPSLLLGIAGVTLIAALLGLPVETIGSRFGGLPRMLPAPALPDLSLSAIRAALPYALSFTLLGAIESLLSAMVADGMTGERHRSNMELIAQGVANMGAAVFGGFCVTGTIARTATNVRAGARTPVAGIAHAGFVLLAMLVLAPLAAFIPLPALGGLLAIVAWNMIERHECVALSRASRGDALVLWVTFLLVIFRDLAEGIVVGFALGGLVFIRHMSEMAALNEGPGAGGARGDDRGRDPAADPAADPGTDPGIADAGDELSYHLRGAVFFGSVARLGSVLERIAARPARVRLDMTEVGFIDVTGARMIHQLADQLARRGGALVIAGASPATRRALSGGGAALHFEPSQG